LIGINKSQGKERLLCQDEEGSEFLIPVEYTNMAQKAKYEEQTKTSCDFRYDDLIELLAIIRNINVK
jgi:hypothetical protein